MKQLKYAFAIAMGMAFTLPTFAQTYINHSFTQASQLVADAGQAMNFCAGDSVMLGGNPAGTGGTAPLSYAWSPPAGLGSTTAANPMASPPATTTYSLQVTDAENCTSNASVVVTLLTVTAAFTAQPNALVVAFTDQSTNATTWDWSFGDGGTSTLQNPSHTYAAPGSYQVCLTVNAGTGCAQTTCDSVSVTAVGIANVQPGVSVQVYPNPVSGNQVQFEIQGIALNGPVEIELFDLQGRMVSHYQGAANQSIHTLNRKELAAGTYQYRVHSADVLVGSGKVVFR